MAKVPQSKRSDYLTSSLLTFHNHEAVGAAQREEEASVAVNVYVKETDLFVYAGRQAGVIIPIVMHYLA